MNTVTLGFAWLETWTDEQTKGQEYDNFVAAWKASFKANSGVEVEIDFDTEASLDNNDRYFIAGTEENFNEYESSKSNVDIAYARTCRDFESGKAWEYNA